MFERAGRLVLVLSIALLFVAVIFVAVPLVIQAQPNSPSTSRAYPGSAPCNTTLQDRGHLRLYSPHRYPDCEHSVQS